ncbi:MAG: hypothetical protein Q9170_007119, partial [Blastenia crenularia]
FDGSDSDSGEDTLPYPQPLPRSAFLTPSFSPTTYLSTLRNRHQTLEDLRTELRTRSQDISKELLDLVNENYQEFLSLGSTLRGGDERVEEVRLGLLGFRREVEALKQKVEERRKMVEGLVGKRREMRREMVLGRKLLDVDFRLGNLERELMVTLDGVAHEEKVDEAGGEMSDSENEDEEGPEGNTSNSRLDRHVRQYLLVRRIVDHVGSDHPFIVNQEGRMSRIKNTLLLDLGNALKQSGSEDKEQTMKLLAAYRELGEAKEALKVLKGRKS